jgi:hypothetical protein
MVKKGRKYKTRKNIEELANTVVEGMDLNDLIRWAVEYHVEYYEKLTSKEFSEAWKERFE